MRFNVISDEDYECELQIGLSMNGVTCLQDVPILVTDVSQRFDLVFTMGASVFDAYTDGGRRNPDTYDGTAITHCDFTEPGPTKITFKMVKGNDKCKAIDVSSFQYNSAF